MLTEREREVLRLVGRGLTNDEIGRTPVPHPAHREDARVAHHVEAAARDRVQLVVVAYETGLVRAGLPGVATRGRMLCSQYEKSIRRGRFAGLPDSQRVVSEVPPEPLTRRGTPC